MESALYGIYALVIFVSEILLVRCAHSFNFWYVNNSCVNTVRQHFPWSILYFLTNKWSKSRKGRRVVGGHCKRDKIQYKYVAVLFYPSWNFYFPLFQTHHHSISNPKAMEYRILACKYSHLSLLLANRTIWTKENTEPAGPSDQCITLAIWHSWVRVPLWLLTGFVLGRPKFNSLATLVNSQLVTFCQGGLILLCSIWIICV